MTPSLLVDATGQDLPPSEERQQPIPVSIESMGGSLIDSARITVFAAIGILPEYQPLPESPLEDTHPSLHDCLQQAMQWLDAARGITVEMGAPVTSLHTVKRG